MVGQFGFTEHDVDGIWGPKSNRVFHQIVNEEEATRFGHRIPSPAGWEHLQAFVVGNDICIRNAKVTCFGGTKDRMDGGVTASGFDTRSNYDFNGCSLPLRRDHVYDHRHGYVLRNSPLPASIPWRTKVLFSIAGKDPLECSLVEIGPANWTGNAGDLMIKPARYFDPHATANNFGIRADIQIVDGAKHLA
jgi:hypothetical protein